MRKDMNVLATAAVLMTADVALAQDVEHTPAPDVLVSAEVIAPPPPPIVVAPAQAAGATPEAKAPTKKPKLGRAIGETVGGLVGGAAASATGPIGGALGGFVGKKLGGGVGGLMHKMFGGNRAEATQEASAPQPSFGEPVAQQPAASAASFEAPLIELQSPVPPPLTSG